jgi:hypothetical protein
MSDDRTSSSARLVERGQQAANVQIQPVQISNPSQATPPSPSR